MTLRGTDLVQAGFATTVEFNGTVVPPQDHLFSDPTTLIVLVPPGATSGPIQVSVGGEDSNTLPFSVVTGNVVADQVIAQFIRGVSIGRGLVDTDTDLLSILPVGREVYHQLFIPDGRGIDVVIRELFATGLVEDAFANGIAEPFVLPSRQNQMPPNDPLLVPQQYGPQRIHAIDENNQTPDAQRLATGAGITIAIIDTGVDVTHDDLDAKTAGSYDATMIPPVAGAAPDLNSHGTHVAGIAAAETDNGIGIAGVAPDARILNVKVLGPGGPNANTNVAVAQGIMFATGAGAQVLNLSLGGGENNNVTNAVFEAVRQGIAVVAAAGNGGDNNLATTDTLCFPAALSENQTGNAIEMANGVIAVGNSTINDTIRAGAPGVTNTCNHPSIGSSNGPHLDVAAPGENIHSTFPGNNFGNLTGTSMAAPHVAGVAAMMLEADPNLTPARVECLLELTSTDIEDDGFDIAAGNGRTAAFAAVHGTKSLAGRYELLPPGCNAPPPPRRNPGRPDGGPDGDGGGGPGTDVPGPAPGETPGIRDLDQVVPITSDSTFAYVATETLGTARIDLTDDSVFLFAGAPFSDPVITASDEFALVLEEPDDPSTNFNSVLRRFEVLDTGNVDSLEIPFAVTELTLTPNSLLALVGTVSSLEVADVDPLAKRGAIAVRPVSGISVTPDSQFALAAVATGVERVILSGAMPVGLLLETDPPITGVTITPDGTLGVVGIEDGVIAVDIVVGTFTAIAGPTPVSNIAVSPDSSTAAYAGDTSVVLVDLANNLANSIAVPRTVTDLDITDDGLLAVVGTESGVSVVELTAPHTHTAIATATPLHTGLNVSPDSAWAAVGTPGGVAVVNLSALTQTQIALGSDPVTNVSIAPNSVDATVGLETGLAVIDLVAQSAQTFALPQARIATTVTADGTWAVYGTEDDLRVVEFGAPASVVNVLDEPPELNDLSDAAQGPNNPSGERGTVNRNEG